jgi:hypothetical protein
MKQTEHNLFPGFKARYEKNFFTYPIILERYWSQLTGSEQKALDFILRNTFGFQKTVDNISVSQFVRGIGKNNKGAGISKAQVIRVLKSLEGKGFINVKRTKYRTNEISLVLENEVISEVQEEGVSSEIMELIELFRPIAGHRINTFKTDKRQIQSLKVLIENYGYENVAQVINYLRISNLKKYAPTVTSPVELDRKWGQLIAYVNKKEDNGFSVSM